MALIKCSECGKKVSDKAMACPKCGMPLEASVYVSGEANAVSGNNTAIAVKSIPLKKILIIVAVCLIALVISFLIYLYAGSNYKLSESTMNQLSITSDEAKIICSAYSELDKECRLSKLFNNTLSQEMTLNQDEAYDILDDKYSKFMTFSRMNMIRDIQKPFSLKYSFHSDVYLWYKSADSINDEYCDDIQDALKFIKENYCE